MQVIIFFFYNTGYIFLFYILAYCSTFNFPVPIPLNTELLPIPYTAHERDEQ